MKKVYQLFLLVAASLFSLTASAGYVQYNLTDTTGTSLGYFVQHDTDQTIAYYDFLIGSGINQVHFNPEIGLDYLKVTSTIYKGQGPTNIGVFDQRTPDFDNGAYVYFLDPNAIAGPYQFTLDYVRTSTLQVSDGSGNLVQSINGYANESAVDPSLAAALDANGGYGDGMGRMVPDYVGPKPLPTGDVPEPGSLALIGIGAIALIRRKCHA